MHLSCPNCGGMLRTNERSGVADERCGNCQWIFMGRVELEALLAVRAQLEHARAQEAVGAPLYEALASGDYGADYRARAQESVGAPLYEALASGANYGADYRADYRVRAQDAVGAPLYEALASGADHRVEYGDEYRDDHRDEYRDEYRDDYHGQYRGEYRRGYPTDGRNERGRPSSRPYLRVVPPLPPDPQPSPLPYRDADPVGTRRQPTGPEPWYQQLAPRLEPARPLRRGRHRHEWSPLEAFD